MENKFEYFDDISTTLKQALKVNNKTEKDMEYHVQIIKDWAKGQPHLPETPDDHVIKAFLIFNKFTIENTKEKLDMYYRMRSLYPEFFQKKHPLLPHMRKAMDEIYFIPMPKTTMEGFRVILFHLPEKNLKTFNVYNFFAHTYNITEVRLHEDYPIGDIIVYDFKNVKLGHLAQFTPTLMKKTTRILEKAFNSNIKQIHCLNYPSYAEPLITLAKQMMNPKISQRFHFHKSYESISKFIPFGILPKDYGGKDLSLQELNELWKRKLADYKDRFDNLEKICVNEKLKPTSSPNDDMLGCQGSFRKLDVD
ncbi:hypothetical protein JTB14_020821 [Gonioctena quinquepunctata]|nr:hypothetical protein JTB14_020821 [Gonioctena quinquepunctata]